MYFLNFFAFIIVSATFGFIFVKQSLADTTSKSVGYNYQDDIDDFDRKPAVRGAGNIVIELGKAAINTIKQDAEIYKASGALAEAVDALTDGLILSIKLTAENGNDIFDLIEKYKGMNITDPEEAIDDIDRGIRSITQSIFHSGVPVLHAFGAVGIIAPGVSKTKLRECIDRVQDSGTAIFDSLEATRILAINGFKSTKRSRDQGLVAAHSAIVAGVSSLNASYIKAAKMAFAYLADVANGKTKDAGTTADNLAAQTKSVAQDSESVSLKEQINLNIQKGLIDGLPSKVLDEIQEGVLADITSSALGIAAAFRAIEEAKNLTKTDSQKALEAIKDGFNAARKGCIDGSVQAYQGFGGAAHLVAQKKVFSAAIEFIENSRIDSTAGIEAGRKLANMGLMSGGNSTEQGLSAAYNAVKSVEIELFTKISNAFNVALKVLNAVTKFPGLV